MMPDWLYFLILFATGLTIGSFINCYVWRRRSNISVAGFSHCVHCGRALSWWEKVPFFSYFYLRCRCRVCGKRIPGHYHAVEFAVGALFVLVGLLDQPAGAEYFQWLTLLRDLFFVSCLAIVFLYDLFYQEILPEVVWVGLLFGALLNLFFLHQDWRAALVGLAIGAGFFLAQYLVSKGRWIGGGDVWLGAMLGVWLGWPLILVVLFFAYLVGALLAVILLIFKKKEWTSALPFGVFLSAAAFFALYWGGAMVNWYLGMIR